MRLISPPRKQQCQRQNNKAPDITWGSVKRLCQRVADEATQAGHGTNPPASVIAIFMLQSSPHNLGENCTLDLIPVASTFNIQQEINYQLHQTLLVVQEEMDLLMRDRFGYAPRSPTM
jgi:hypothetical protein